MRRAAGIGVLLACGMFGAEEAANAEPDMTNWKWANFAILAGVMGYLIAKNAGPFFSSRSAEIRRGIDEASQMRTDAEARAASMEQKMASLGAEIEDLRKTARQEADADSQRLRQDAERELAKIQANADQEIASALKAAQADLKRHAGALAVDLARKKVKERLTDADQDALVRSFSAGVKLVQ